MFALQKPYIYYVGSCYTRTIVICGILIAQTNEFFNKKVAVQGFTEFYAIQRINMFVISLYTQITEKKMASSQKCSAFKKKFFHKKISFECQLWVFLKK